ncbi:MAG: hypothetical protein Kow0059_11460 [Candidatus Sumerlaeia bacterium]
MRLLEDDFYPEDLEQQPTRPAPPARPSARRRLIPPPPELRHQRLYYLYLFATFALCALLAGWAMVNRAHTQRLGTLIEQVERDLARLDQFMLGLPPQAQQDPRLQEQQRALLNRQTQLLVQMSRSTSLPVALYIPVTLLMAGLIFSALRLAPRLGRSILDLFKAGVCLVAAALTALGFNLAFVWFYYYRQMWIFSIAFGLMVLSIVLLISPNLYMIFAGRRLRQSSHKPPTLEELQEQLPFFDDDEIP